MKTLTRYQLHLHNARMWRKVVRILYKKGLTQSEIAERFGCSRQRIHQIVNSKK